MLLSITIPTLNRENFVVPLCNSLLIILKRLGMTENDFEIIVSVNHSKDSSLVKLQNLSQRHPELKVFSPPTFLETAEENLMFAFAKVSGEYCWLLGDDDVPHEAGIEKLIQHIKKNAHDIIIFDSSMISWDGTLIHDRRTLCQKSEIDENFQDLAARLGLWFVLAGLSTTVIRSKDVTIDKLREISAIAPIYSHVIWLLYSFHNKKALFVNSPLVGYRVNESSASFENLAVKKELFKRVFWTLHPIRQFNWLIEQGKYSKNYFKYVTDQVISHKRARLLDNILLVVREQILDQWSVRQGPKLEENELREITDFALEADPQLFHYVRHLHDLADAVKNKDKKKLKNAEIALRSIIKKFIGNGIFVNAYVSTENNFQIYKLHSNYVACHSNHLEYLNQSQLFIDLLEVKPFIFFADTLEQLSNKIKDIDTSALYKVNVSRETLMQKIFNSARFSSFRLMARLLPRGFRNFLKKLLNK